MKRRKLQLIQVMLLVVTIVTITGMLEGWRVWVSVTRTHEGIGKSSHPFMSKWHLMDMCDLAR